MFMDTTHGHEDVAMAPAPPLTTKETTGRIEQIS
jgi:hypothetical protein